MIISAPKFEAVFNNNGQFFRLLQDSFHPTEYVDDIIASIYVKDNFVTYIVDDALVHYMKMSFKRLKEGRRLKFPNYEIIGLSRSGFTPFEIPEPKVGTVGNFEAKITGKTFMCGSTQLKRKMVISSMIDLKRKYGVKEVLYFIAYSDEFMAKFSSEHDVPIALMAADLPGRMSEYFGPWHDWYYLRCSHQDITDLALVNSRTGELYIPRACPAGVGDHGFFKQDPAIEDWIATNTSLTSGQAKNTNVQADFGSDAEVMAFGTWMRDADIDINWGGLGRGRDDSFGLCSTVTDYGPTMVLRVKTAVPGLYFCGVFMKYASDGIRYRYTPLPVKNQTTLNAINTHNNMSFE